MIGNAWRTVIIVRLNGLQHFRSVYRIGVRTACAVNKPQASATRLGNFNTLAGNPIVRNPRAQAIGIVNISHAVIPVEGDSSTVCKPPGPASLPTLGNTNRLPTRGS